MTVRILCYGDSNTFGYVPAGAGARYDERTRWCGQLRSLLGKEYSVIEAGQNGRTTDLDVPGEPLRNGLKNIDRTLQINAPADLIILMLGTNDCKEEFQRDEKVIAQSLASLVKRFRKTAAELQENIPQIIIVSPAVILRDAASGPFGHEFTLRSHEVSKRMKNEYAKTAKELNTLYLDASQYIEASPLDGIHLSKEAHTILAQKLYELIGKIETQKP